MFSSALSDDGKSSTKALRGLGASELDDNFHYNEERIDEVSSVKEGSGRTSPPGTIGEAHEYMSENIESNIVHRVKQKTGNQSVIGAKDQKLTKKESTFENRKVSEETVVASKVRAKVALSNDNHVAGFKIMYDKLFKEFHSNMIREYNLTKEGYIEDF